MPSNYTRVKKHALFHWYIFLIVICYAKVILKILSKEKLYEQQSYFKIKNISKSFEGFFYGLNQALKINKIRIKNYDFIFFGRERGSLRILMMRNVRFIPIIVFKTSCRRLYLSNCKPIFFHKEVIRKQCVSYE